MSVLAILAALSSFGSLAYLTAFIANWPIVPKTINTGESWFPLSSNPYLNNILFFLIFSIHHSGMIHKRIGAILQKLLSKRIFGNLYGISASVCVVVFCLGWMPIPYPVWSLASFPLLSKCLSVFNGFCWLYLAYCVVLSSPIDNAVVNMLKSKKTKPGTLIVDGIYSYIRHPLMTGLLVTMWIYPYMSVGHLLYCCIATLYIVFAVVVFEEPKLIQEFGQPYIQYMKKVPRFIPGLI